MQKRTRQVRQYGIFTLALTVLAGCAPTAPASGPQPERARGVEALIPVPVEVRPSDGAPFTITATTALSVQPGSAEITGIAEKLAYILRPSTGFPIPVNSSATASDGSIRLELASDAALGDEGYRLDVSAARIVLTANRPAGLFRGIQTIRQLLPPTIESEYALRSPQWTVPAGVIVDHPRFGWRGSMLDVARHFFTVDEVKQYIDGMAMYKMNILHLHLSDDQGWRIQIRSRPLLTEIGSKTEVGGGPGGFYTQDEYRELVRYAGERYITVVPEIDMPAHTNAALSAYPELSCSRRPPGLYRGTEVGFSALCHDNEGTYRLIEDVVRELAEMTPGPYIHIGGDEVEMLNDEQYVHFIERVQEIVNRAGKRMVGWEEVGKARLLPTSLAQQWKKDSTPLALQHGAKLIMSPATRAYIDMKYHEGSPLGLDWAARIEVEDAYTWDPATVLAGVQESDVVGVEAPLWAETIRNITAAEYLAYPRLPAIAEIGWSTAASRDWASFRTRLAAQGPRWDRLGINYYRSTQVPWE
jgi:hexosaminidase